MYADFLSKYPLDNRGNSNVNECNLACVVSNKQENLNGLKSQLEMTMSYLMDFYVNDLDVSTRAQVRRNAKTYAVWDGNLFRRVGANLKLVPK